MDFVTNLVLFVVALASSYLIFKELVAAGLLFRASCKSIEYSNVVCLDTYVKGRAIGLNAEAVSSGSLAAQIIMLKKRDEVLAQIEKTKGSKNG
ncbi:hypothetical protein L3V43_20695 [Pseudoalteromonas sp. L23]|uniref:hypothetical protein n=1 Tax=unclassified Pseudoalteromonas TaxID=194690 RepID=UPI00110BF10D|nr:MULTISPECIES: hypothetical protein [unclassified Pseudoalteromonas]MCF7515956.1 hypothetical protein [Pseudoalteromonas sp. L7]MCF7528072.1 hypothetical protein [Pseudoalteromonas sp. L23]QUI70505.1 hypothetical protein GSF13_12320 [Pseudoalteromonas sp. M8]TMN44837.1 hypothetical protein CWC03_03070 [Pseudoalteromonas sp. S2755]